MSNLVNAVKAEFDKMKDDLGMDPGGKAKGSQEASMKYETNLSNPSLPRNVCCVLDGNESVVMKAVGYPEMRAPSGVPIDHGVIVKVICSNICGSDLHMYRMRTNAGKGMVMGHEVTGLVIEKGPAVEVIQLGDIVSVPFNIACGKCESCKLGETSHCLRCNPDIPGAAYGYAQMGGWQGGQGEYMLVPYADFNLMQLDKKFVLKDVNNMLDCAFLSDILPTSMDGCYCAGVGLGKRVFIAGCGPVGLCAIISCFLLGAAEVVAADHNEERLKMAAALGAKPLNINQSGAKADILHDGKWIMAELEKLIGVKEVDCCIDCVGYEATELGKGADGPNNPEIVINTALTITKVDGGVGFPGVYFPSDPKGPDSLHKTGFLPIKLGNAFCKGINLRGRQCPVMRWNKQLYALIQAGRVPPLHKALNAKIITLDQVPEAYTKFNKGEPCKYVIDPHGYLKNLKLLEKEIQQLTGGKELKDKMHESKPQ